MKIETIVIGLGKIGMMYDFFKRNHFNNHCEAIKLHPKFNLNAGIETDLKKSDLFKKKYALPVFKSTNKALLKLDPDLIIISVPTEKSAKIFKILQNSNIKKKNILLEKPGSYNHYELKKFISFCKIRNLKLFINYTRSFSYFIKDLKNTLKTNNFGKIQKIEIFYHKGIFNSCSHYLNFLLKFFKNEQIKILKIYKKKKLLKDYLIDFDIKLKVPIFFRYTKKNIKEKIIIYGKKKLTYITEESKTYITEKNKKNVKNDFKNNLKNVLNAILTYNKKKIESNILKDLLTLEIITKIVNEKKI